jgi:hypothetical protein
MTSPTIIQGKYKCIDYLLRGFNRITISTPEENEYYGSFSGTTYTTFFRRYELSLKSFHYSGNGIFTFTYLMSEDVGSCNYSYIIHHIKDWLENKLKTDQVENIVINLEIVGYQKLYRHM